MAIPYEPKPLPAVTTVDFNVSHWAGVNKIKGSQADGEMADCKNMCADNFPYASPRKSREKLLDESGIQRIYKVDGNRVYYIDNEGYLCYTESGAKHYLTHSEKKIQIKPCSCTNNYDEFSIFYPNIFYVDSKFEAKGITETITFIREEEQTVREEDEFGDEITEFTSDTICRMYYASYRFDVKNYEVNKAVIKLTLPEAKKYEYPELNTGNKRIRIVLRIYDKDGNTKKYTDESGKEHPVLWNYVDINGRENEYVFDLPEDITLSKGDYCLVRVGGFGYYADNTTETKRNTAYILKGEWQITSNEYGEIITGPVLDYGVVYNNRIVGVRESDIRASALGDFANFWDYVDEAGNPDAVGAYATDVGSAGEFTGICVYNNVLLLFKKDIVYEMYGSMPYTITELCTTGCIDNDSIASVDGVLYWASPKGIVRYSGGVPVVISTQIDIDTSGICKAGTDGRKYYVYDGKRTFVYDTYYQLWHIEDDKNVNMFYNHINDLYAVYDGGIYKIDSGSEAVEWEFETKDYTFGSKERKNLSKLWLRADMPKNSRLEVYVKQNGGEWQRVAVKTAEKDEMFDFKLRVKKCDSFALKFKGKGDVRILDIHGKITVGTSKHRSGASLNVYRK